MADHEDYLPGEAPAAHKTTHQDEGTDEISLAGLSGTPAALATHALLPTVHQDAPDLIETHRLVPAAHHAKYTDAEVKALFSPLSIPCSSFTPVFDTYDFSFDNGQLANRTSITGQAYTTPLFFPNGVTISKLSLYAYCNHASASITLSLRRTGLTGGQVVLCELISDWTTGYGLIFSTDIDYAVIDVLTHSYFLNLYLDPGAAVNDCRLSGILIEFTV